ncbi:MAG: hypothetical protein ACI4M9_05165, partial [Succinivibrio sp.]
LKNFLIRAQKECRKYVEDYPKGSKSERVRKVRIVGSKIKEILSLPVMASITEQTSLPTPNYVLQSERKYNAIWKYYINLVRKEKQLEKSFLYQDNTFRNMVELLLQGALQHLSQGKEKVSFEIREIGTSVLDINQEQQLGVRVKSQALGPFLITKKNGSSYYVRLTTDAFISDKHGKEIYPKYASLKYLGTKSFIIVYGITSKGIDPKAIFLIPVYAVNAIQCEHPETPEKIFADACSELELAQKLPDMNKYKLGGIVLTNHRDHSEEKFFKNGCALFAFSDVPSEWGYNAISLSSFIATYLEQLLK